MSEGGIPASMETGAGHTAVGRWKACSGSSLKRLEGVR